MISPSGAAAYIISGGGLNIVSPSTTTSYSVTGISAEGCVSSNTAISTVSVYSNPTIVPLSSSPGICSGGTATLSAGGASSYTWSPGNETGNTLVVSPGATVTYTVAGKNASGCVSSQTLSLVVVICAGVNETGTEQAIRLYPNPTNSEFVIETKEDCTVRILNSLGKLVHETRSVNGETSVDLGNVAAGIYFVKLQSSHSERTVRLIKQ
jgi:hypothetical protein